MKDFRVQIRVKNNRLMSAMEAAGYQSVESLVSALGKGGNARHMVYNLLAMKRAPILAATGEWHPIVARICELVRKMPDDLFPVSVQRIGLKRNHTEFEMDAGDLDALLPSPDALDPARMIEHRESSAALDVVLDSLTEREKEILKRRFGYDCEAETYEQIADSHGVTRERVRQIEAKALRKLRHPIRASVIRDSFGAFGAFEQTQERTEDEPWTIHDGVRDEPEKVRQ